MINEGNFRKAVEHIINFPEKYTKDDIYDAFLEMTERYLDEMISTLNMEKAITQDMSDEDANKLIEEIALSSPVANNLEEANASADDEAQVIQNLLDYIECELGFTIE